MTRPSRCRRAARDDRVYVNPGSIPEAFAFAYLGAKDGPIAYKKFRSTLCLDEEQVPRSRNTIWWLNKLQVDNTDLATPAGRAYYRSKFLALRVDLVYEFVECGDVPDFDENFDFCASTL